MRPLWTHFAVLCFAAVVGAYLVGKFPQMNLLGKVLP